MKTIRLSEFELKVLMLYLARNPCVCRCCMKYITGHERRLSCYEKDSKGHICPILEAKKSIESKILGSK